MEEDDLYGLPLEEFTAQRDALAKQLRKDGDGEAAARVKALRKPTLAAWAVNQVIRTQPKAARELAAAGEALRKAQTALMSGKGSGEKLRAASERERAAVDQLLNAARGLLSGSGGSLAEGTLEKVAETLRAAAGDDETREAVLAGRLDRERQAAGLGGELGFLAATPAPATRGKGAPAQPSGRGAAAKPSGTGATTRPAKREKEKGRAR